MWMKAYFICIAVIKRLLTLEHNFITKELVLLFFPILLIVFGLVFIWLGIFRIRKPQSGWRYSESWKHRDDIGEPSEYYLMQEKLSGMIIIVVGSFFVLFGIMQLLQEIFTTK